MSGVVAGLFLAMIITGFSPRVDYAAIAAVIVWLLVIVWSRDLRVVGA